MYNLRILLYPTFCRKSTNCRKNNDNKSMEKNVFGKNLKELRTEKGLSQRELGKEFGVCNQTISFWELGSREPDLDFLVKISDFFNVSIDYLLGKKDF